MSNFFDWDAKMAAEEVMKKWDFVLHTSDRGHLFNMLKLMITLIFMIT